MPPLDCIKFSTAGWTPEEAREEGIVWTNERGDRMEFSVKESPRLPPLYPVEDLQRFVSREWQDDRTALISLDVVSIRGSSLIRGVMKHYDADNLCSYSGLLLLPFRDFSYELRIHTVSSHFPSVRETEVKGELKQNEKPDLWYQDPYNTESRSTFLCSESDYEEYDDRYPEHPLTCLRREMQVISASFEAAREVKNSVPFQGNL